MLKKAHAFCVKCSNESVVIFLTASLVLIIIGHDVVAIVTGFFGLVAIKLSHYSPRKAEEEEESMVQSFIEEAKVNIEAKEE